MPNEACSHEKTVCSDGFLQVIFRSFLFFAEFVGFFDAKSILCCRHNLVEHKPINVLVVVHITEGAAVVAAPIPRFPANSQRYRTSTPQIRRA